MRRGPQVEFETEFHSGGHLAWRVSRFKAGTMATSRAHIGERLLVVLHGDMRVLIDGQPRLMHAGDWFLAGSGKTMIYCETPVEVMAVNAIPYQILTEQEVEALVIEDEPLYRMMLGVPSPGLLAKE